jgi:hypothetical protein
MYECRIRTTLYFPYRFVAPTAGKRTVSVYIPMDLQRCEICIELACSESGSATQPADMGGGDRMILWLISIVGVIVGVIATGTSFTDPEAKILLGLALMGVVIRLQCGSGKRD